MDRRGPNSAIQGMSSDEGFEGGRNVQHLVWSLLESQGQPFTLRQSNSVHDSTENVADAVDIPLACYIVEHAFTTLVHRNYREVYGLPMIVDLQMEMDIGPSLCNVESWDYQGDSLLDLIQKGLEWNNKELGHNLDIKQTMKKVTKNVDTVLGIRRKEIKTDMTSKEASELMLLTRDNVFDQGLLFALPRRKDT
jgi:hypothetical protein